MIAALLSQDSWPSDSLAPEFDVVKTERPATAGRAERSQTEPSRIADYFTMTMLVLEGPKVSTSR